MLCKNVFRFEALRALRYRVSGFGLPAQELGAWGSGLQSYHEPFTVVVQTFMVIFRPTVTAMLA